MTASNQKYLKAVYVLSRKSGSVRAADVAAALSVTRPSASNGLKKLVEKGYVEHEPNGGVRLTSEGMRRAEEMIRSYAALRCRVASRPPRLAFLLGGDDI